MSDLDARVAMLERMVASLSRRLGSTVGFARSTAAPIDTGAIQTVQGRMDALSVRDNMPVLFHYGFSSSMPVGGDKVVNYLNGDRSTGVVVATGHQSYRIKGLVTGEVAVYDMWGRSIKLGASGPVVDCNGAPLQILNCGTLTADATLLKVKGDVIDNYPTNARTMAGMRSVFNAHVHTDPQGGNTSVPTSSM